MNKNHSLRNRTGPASPGEEVWREAQQLLPTIRFTHGRGDYARGERVCVLVDVQPGETPDTFDAGLLLFPLGEARVDVEGFPIALAGWAEGYHVLRPGEKTNHRGFVTFKNLPQGEYRLLLPKGVIAGTEPIRLSKALAAADVPPAPLVEEFCSKDSSVVCTLYETSEGELVLSFDVVVPEGEGASVEYALVEEPSGAVATVEIHGEPRALAGQVALTPGAEGHYLARASLGYNVALPGPYSLRAYLLPPGLGEREPDGPTGGGGQVPSGA